MLVQEAKLTISGLTVKERAVIYARVSTDEQAETGTSLDNQEERSLAYAKANNLHIVGIFREDYTGKVLDRPELAKVRELLQSGQAEHLIAYKPNRLDRSEWGINLLILLQELKQLGVSLHYSKNNRQIDLDNPIEALMQSISGWQAGEDHRETVTKLHEGRRNKVKKGSAIVGSRPPYGYNSVKVGKDWKLEIEPTQAETIKRIFTWFVVGDETGKTLSCNGIAKKLTKIGIPTKGDIDKRFVRKRPGWSHSTIRYFLANETYAGVFWFGKRNTFTQTNNDRKSWIAVQVPAIVDRELWEAAQQKLKINKLNASRNTKYKYLMRTKITCGRCNYKAFGNRQAKKRTGRAYFYYVCANKDRGLGCDMLQFSVAKVDNKVWEWIEEILTDDTRRRKGLEAYQAALAKKASPIQQELGYVKDLISEKKAEWDNTMESLRAVKSPRAKAVLSVDLERIEGTLDELQKRDAKLTKQLNISTLNDEQKEAIDKLAHRLAQGLDIARNNFDHKRNLIEILGVEGTMIIEEGKRKLLVKACFGTFEQELLIDDNTTVSICSLN